MKMAQPFQCLVRPPSGVVLGRLVVLFLHLRHFLPFSSHFQLLFKFLQQLSLVSHVSHISHVSLFSFRFHLCFWLLALDCDFRILCSKILHLQFYHLLCFWFRWLPSTAFRSSSPSAFRFLIFKLASVTSYPSLFDR